MKDSLRPLDGKFRVFTATYDRMEVKMRYGISIGNQVLLRDVRDKADHAVIDQLWVSEAIAFRELTLRPGDRLRFSAKVMPHYTTNKDDADFRLVEVRRMSLV